MFDCLLFGGCCSLNNGAHLGRGGHWHNGHYKKSGLRTVVGTTMIYFHELDRLTEPGEALIDYGARINGYASTHLLAVIRIYVDRIYAHRPILFSYSRYTASGK